MPRPSTFLIIGLGTFGSQAAINLGNGGATVIAIDRSRERVERVAHVVSKAAALDANEEEALAELGAFDAHVAIVSLGDFFDTTVLATHMLRRRGIKEVVVQVNSQRQAEAIRAVGATEVAFPEQDTAERLAERFLDGPVTFERIAIGRDAGIIELPVPQNAVGRSLRDLELRARYQVTVVALKSMGRDDTSTETVSVTPDAAAPLTAGQLLVVLGHNHHLARFRDQFPEKG